MIFNNMHRSSLYRVFFTGLNLFLLLYTVTSAEQKEIEITSFYAKVYVAPNKNANFIGLTQKGERYPVLGVSGEWYSIRFKNINGWIQSTEAKTYDPYAAATEKPDESVEVDSLQQDSTASSQTVIGTTLTSSETVGNTTVSGRGDTQATSSTQQPSIPQQTISRSTSPPPKRPSPPSRPRRQSETDRRSSSSSAAKKESRLKSWFTQQKLPELPPTIIPEDDQIASLRYFQVRFPARVLEYLSPDAPILGMAKKGSLLPLVAEGDSWCRVVFADTIGWVESKHGKIIDPDESVSLDYVKVGLIVGITVLIVVMVIILLTVRRRRKGEIDRESTIKRNVLIIAKSSKTVQYTLTNGTTTLDRCFTEVGFDISYAKDSAAIKAYLQSSKPDIIMMDYKFDSSIISSVERICAPMGLGATTLFIAYNVPDPAIMHPSKVLPRMAFLGITFSDRDVFKLVTPMLRTATDSTIQKSVQSSALEGTIGEGNLLEVLQFIEIGSKTGCLLIEQAKPFAIICFKNGRIVFAATADKITGRDAIFKVLDLNEGKFRFVLDKKPKEANVNLSTLEILMEWAKAIDEANQH